MRLLFSKLGEAIGRAALLINAFSKVPGFVREFAAVPLKGVPRCRLVGGGDG
jgi:hypothetical protein